MICRNLLILCFIFSWCPLQAGDTLAAATVRVRERLSPAENFNGAAYRNPAVMQQAFRSSLSALQLGGALRNAGQAVVSQLGAGMQEFRFDASSYIRLDEKSRAWGNAWYRKGRREEVKWNETSDFMLVYPYVMADTIGGDLFFEEYFFAGGYSRKSGRVGWGVYLDYRALNEYRKADPRPKNTVSDLKVSAGAVMEAGERYAAGAALYGGRYKQDNQIDFFSELGASRVFHLTGLGMDYTRFAGNRTSTFYNGYSYGGSVELLPKDKSGFSVSAAYRYFGLEKILNETNSLPFSDLSENSLNAEFAWTKHGKTGRVGVKMTLDYRKRDGMENLFGEAANGVYARLGKAKQFGGELAGIRLAGVYENKLQESFSWYILPEISAGNIRLTYADPYRLAEAGRMSGEVVAGVAKSVRKSLFHFKAEAEYSGCVRSDIQLSETGVADGVMLSNFNNLSGERAKLKLGVRWDYALAGNQGLFVRADWSGEKYVRSMNVREVSGSVGFIF